MEYAFGTGSLFAVPTGSNQQPVIFAAMQDMSLDISATLKELFGRYEYPLTVARGTIKLTGKAKVANFNANMFNAAFFGQSVTSGAVIQTAVDEAQTITANAFTATNGANYKADLGVYYAANGVALAPVAAGPLAGQYTVNVSNGNYTFNSADNNVAMKINYQYTSAGGAGKQIVVANQLLGQANTFGVYFATTYGGQQFNVQLKACASSKLAIATKLEDFTVPEFDWQAFADASGNVMVISTNE